MVLARLDPLRAERVRKAAKKHLEEHGTTGRVDGLLIPVDEIGEWPLRVVEAIGQEELTTLLDDPSATKWTAAEEGHISLKLSRAMSLILLSGEVTLALECTCVRCLERVVFDVAFDVELHLSSTLVENALSDEITLDEDAIGGVDIVPFNGDVVDLPQLLREQIFLEVPMHPACGHEGARVTEKCEVRGAAAAEAEANRWQDPRWAALRDLRDKLPE